MRAAWNRFWFEPRPTTALALFRMLYGLVVAAWALSLLPDTLAFLSGAGVLPEDPQTRFLRTGLLALFTSDAAAWVVVGGLFVAALLLALGVRTRIASILCFVLLLSISRRNPEINNSGDSLLRHFAFFLMFAPAGSTLSWDSWRQRGELWSAPLRAPWALRLIQIQVSLVYFFSTFAKVQGTAWVDGTALADIWRAGDVARFSVPLFIHDSLLASNLGTYATLLVELALAILIWHRPARPYVIAAGLLLHLGIELTLSVGFFSIAVCTGYLAFLSDERAEALVAAVRDRQLPRVVRLASPMHSAASASRLAVSHRRLRSSATPRSSLLATRAQPHPRCDGTSSLDH